MSRHSDYTDELAETICGRLAVGESLRSICGDESLPHISTVMRWLAKNEKFREQYAIAREAQAEYLIDEIVEIADDGSNDYMEKLDSANAIIGWRENGEFISRSRLRVDARKWAASKLAPRRYGERVTTENTTTVKVEHTRKLDISQLSDEQLDTLETVLRATVAQLDGPGPVIEHDD